MKQCRREPLRAFALIMAILFVFGGEQFSPHAVFFYLAAIVLIWSQVRKHPCFASTWLSVVIGGIVLYEPQLTTRPRCAASSRSFAWRWS